MRGIRHFRTGLHCVFAMAMGIVMQACAPKVDDEVETIYQCELPADQSKTLSARWKKTVIPLAFKSGDFSGSELGAIMDAADRWNTHYMKTQGMPVFDYGTRSSPRMSTVSKAASICSYTLINNTTGQFQGSVVIYKHTSWPYSAVDAIALTSFCKTAATPLSNMYMAIMEVNYQYFFVSGRRQPDLSSIFVHELGHLLGLDHSCSASTKEGFPNCNDASLNQAYYDAIMFPTVFFDSSGVGQSRVQLQVNDQSRANCLYGGTAL